MGSQATRLVLEYKTNEPVPEAPSSRIWKPLVVITRLAGARSKYTVVGRTLRTVSGPVTEPNASVMITRYAPAFVQRTGERKSEALVAPIRFNPLSCHW